MKRLTIYTICYLLLLTNCNTSDSDKNSFSNSNKKTAKNIILLIGDGMGISQITAGMYASDSILNLERFKFIGLQKTDAANHLVTDSAAGATAFATGKKTNNGVVGMDAQKQSAKNILEYAKEKGLATGLVATSQIAHATPAGFFAHHPKRSEMETIAAQLLETDVDLLIGGGQNHFEARKDGRNISNELSKKGYQVHSFMTKSLSETEPNYKDNFLYFTAASLPLSVEQGRDYLPLATSFSIDFLKNHSSKGFFLMVESSQIDWGGHNNNSDYIIQEMLDFDKVIGAALDFAEADGNTLVIVTSDHETGGYSINYGSSRKNFKVGFTTDYHTAQMVPVFAYGPNQESFIGIYDNTAIFKKMMKAFGIEE